MGSECDQNRRSYDLSMSRRTRKSSPAMTPDQNGHLAEIPIPKAVEGEATVDPKNQPKVVDDGLCDRRSLKELMTGDEGESVEWEGGKHAHHSLGQRTMEEEKNLALVPLQAESTEQGSKFAGMVSRYVKVLNHLIKVKRERRVGPGKKGLSRK